MSQSLELGQFLRSRRARITPEEAGLVHYGGRRRVPGLRREELAQLAGISVAYYIRLEQGQSLNASDAVLDAIAQVLRLDEEELLHLHSLARQPPRNRRRARPEQLRPGIHLLVERMGDVPAIVVGRSSDVLAWNRLAHALLAGHLDFHAPERAADRPNLARLVFLDPHTRELYVDWKRKSRDAVAYLRRSAGQFPDDPQLTALVGELTMQSREFLGLWSSHPVRNCAFSTRDYRHPLVGTLTLTDEMLQLPDDGGQRVVVYTAQPGSPSESALKLLDDISSGRLETKPSAAPPAKPSWARQP
ncbi:helix-turn-helix domain-containing protein [Streptomyces polygonati]|uniref:Helix-turn-helix domain-containing protein n=1 Tax=Streptomyces polygonati TaxID=1617087 RepID=A0ABV8HGA4_9ACTN